MKENTYAVLIIMAYNINKNITATKIKQILVQIKDKNKDSTHHYLKPPDGYYNNKGIVIPTPIGVVEGRTSDNPDIISNYSIDNKDLEDVYDSNGNSYNVKGLVHSSKDFIPRLNYLINTITLFIIKQELIANGITPQQIVFDLSYEYTNIESDLEILYEFGDNIDYFEGNIRDDIAKVAKKYPYNQYRIKLVDNSIFKISIMEHYKCYES